MRERTGSQGDSESESPGASSRGTDEDKPGANLLPFYMQLERLIFIFVKLVA